MHKQSISVILQQQNMLARLTGLNQLLEDIYQKPHRLSDILAERKYSQQYIQILRDSCLEPFFNEFIDGLRSMLQELRNGERHSDIITRRYGLENGKRQTLKEIAENYNLSGERIRQLQAKAIRSMRNRKRKTQLEGLVVTVSKNILGESETPLFKQHVALKGSETLLVHNKVEVGSYSVERIRKEYPKAYRKWTEEEHKYLENEFKKGRSITELAELFQRQPSAIRSLLSKLGLVNEGRVTEDKR